RRPPRAFPPGCKLYSPPPPPPAARSRPEVAFLRPPDPAEFRRPARRAEREPMRQPRRPPRPRTLLRVEQLEDRTTPARLVVAFADPAGRPAEQLAAFARAPF